MHNFIFADIEASSLINGYPIEIGWAWRESGKAECAATLINPPASWVATCIWDRAAEGVHGVSRELLDKFGDTPRHACTTLNLALNDQDLVFDTGGNGADAYWMRMLFMEADLKPTFGILTATSEEVIRSRAALLGVSNEVYSLLQAVAPAMPHRAAVDAAYWVWWLIALEIASAVAQDELSLTPSAVAQLSMRCGAIPLPSPTQTRPMD